MRRDAVRRYADLAELVQQIAVVTATSHTRGTVGKSPGQFKEVISAALGPSFARATWGMATVRIAAAYREQVCGADDGPWPYPRHPSRPLATPLASG